MPDDGDASAYGGKGGDNSGADGVGKKQIGRDGVDELAKAEDVARERPQIAEQNAWIGGEASFERGQGMDGDTLGLNQRSEIGVGRASDGALVGGRIEGGKSVEQDALGTTAFAGVIAEQDAETMGRH